MPQSNERDDVAADVAAHSCELIAPVRLATVERRGCDNKWGKSKVARPRI